DKAGREGLLDNNAAKTLKIVVANILMKLAREFFGSASDIRTELLPEIQKANKKARAAEERNKLRRKQRSQFSSKLKQFSKELPSFLASVREAERSVKLDSEKGKIGRAHV